MDTRYILIVAGMEIVSTYDIHEYLTARKSALMALTAVGLAYTSLCRNYNGETGGYLIERFTLVSDEKA